MKKYDHSSTLLILAPINDAAVYSLQSNPNLDAGLITMVNFSDTDQPHPEQRSQWSSSDSRSRESTPLVFPSPEPQLHLKLDSLPKTPQRGWLFGCSEKQCDVVLNSISGGISREHCFLDFNWDSAYARVNNLSQYGTQLIASSITDGTCCLKGNDRRVIFPGEQTQIRIGPAEFIISWPSRNPAQRAVFEQIWANSERPA